MFGAVPAPAARDMRPGQARQEATGPRVLVVDDNATNRNVLCRRLERQGYAVEEAPNGEAALDRIATESFDVVLLDIMMPVMDGFEVLATDAAGQAHADRAGSRHLRPRRNR